MIKLHLMISLFCFMLTVISVYILELEIKREYGKIKSKYTFAEKILINLQLIFVLFIPIINIFLTLLVVFGKEALKDKVIKDYNLER